MNAKEFLAEKGVFSLDTKKRYNEVVAWMEEYAALRQSTIVERSERCTHPRNKREYIGSNMLKCNVCGEEFN